MKSARLLALVLFLSPHLWATTARADSLAETFERGNAAFARGDYAVAIGAYQTLREAGVDDADVSFNRAISHARLGQYGHALQFLEHTLMLAPRDTEASTTLTRVRQALGQRQASVSGEAIVATRPPIIEAIFAKVTASELAATLLLGAWALVICLGALRWLRKEAERLAMGIAAGLSALLAVAGGLGLGAKTDWGAEGRRALVVSEAAPVREGPDEHATLREELPEGARIRTFGRVREFVRVETPSGVSAYMRATDVGEI
jgi:tetratricopeptide (TPR) repeat protein